MSKEKLSSRQKIIVIMYLVLTSMLALQVSSSVLDKFIFFSDSIDNSRNVQLAQNERTIEALKNRAKDLFNRPKDIKILLQASIMHQDTLKLVSYIDQLKKQLINQEGGLNSKTKLPKGLKNDGGVYRLMINKGEGNILKSKLNQYILQISKLVNNPYKPITLDAQEYSFPSSNSNKVTKDFITSNFDHTPLGAALAILSQFASQVVATEAHALYTLASIIGASDVRFDTLKLLANTKSYIVAAGSQYEADLILSASSSSVTPKMFVNDQSIVVQNGIGKVNFTATPGEYDSNGLVKKTFKAAIKLKSPKGKEFILTQNIPYLVAKPIIQLKSAVVQSLYRNCGNELDIQVPSLGLAYNPTFKVEGGELILGSKKSIITVIPKRNKVYIHIYNQTHLIDIKSFMVQDIPTPKISITTNGQPIDLNLGIVAPGPRVLEVKVVPDKYFQDLLPKDARYKVVEWSITLARGTRPIHILQVTDSLVDITNIASLAKSGDRLVIEIKKIQRQNFKNQLETIMDKSCFNILLH